MMKSWSASTSASTTFWSGPGIICALRLAKNATRQINAAIRSENSSTS